MDRFRRSAVAAGFVGLSLVPSSLYAQVGLPLGTPAPAVSVQDLSGNPVDLLNLTSGKPALIEFWAIWCEFCEALQPQLDRIQRDYGDRVNVVAVAVGVNQTPRRIRRHLEAHDPGYPYVFDAAGVAVRAFNVVATSIVTVLDQEGNVAYVGAGPNQDLVGAIESVLDELR